METATNWNNERYRQVSERGRKNRLNESILQYFNIVDAAGSSTRSNVLA